MTSFETNVVNFTITEGQKHWYVVRAYVPPNDQPMVHRVEQALACGLEGVEMLLVSDLNVRLVQPRGLLEEYLATAIMSYRIVNQTLHFIPRSWYRGKGG